MKTTISVIIAVLIVGGLAWYFVAQRNTNDNSNATNTTSQTNTTVTNTTTNNTPANTNTAVATADCLTANLTAALTDRQGTAGTYYYTLGLKNTGTSSCVYSGTTKVSLVNAAGTTLGSTSMITSADLTLAANQTIYAAVGFPNSANFTNATACQSGVTTLAVLPPSQSTAVSVAGLTTLAPGWTNFYCPGFSVGVLSTVKP